MAGIVFLFEQMYGFRFFGAVLRLPGNSYALALRRAVFNVFVKTPGYHRARFFQLPGFGAKMAEVLAMSEYRDVCKCARFLSS